LLCVHLLGQLRLSCPWYWHTLHLPALGETSHDRLSCPPSPHQEQVRVPLALIFVLRHVRGLPPSRGESNAANPLFWRFVRLSNLRPVACKSRARRCSNSSVGQASCARHLLNLPRVAVTSRRAAEGVQHSVHRPTCELPDGAVQDDSVGGHCLASVAGPARPRWLPIPQHDLVRVVRRSWELQPPTQKGPTATGGVPSRCYQDRSAVAAGCWVTRPGGGSPSRFRRRGWTPRSTRLMCCGPATALVGREPRFGIR
jgi:hypothetical protein